MVQGHVVIVDNEVRLRETIGNILERQDYAVTLLESGEELLSWLESHTPDVILLDLKMSRVDGNAILPHILNAHPELRVIVLTGHGTLAAAKEAAQAGAFDFLCKPCDVNILVSRIHDAVLSKEHNHASERCVTEVMIPIDEYTCIQAASTIREGIEQLRVASDHLISAGLIMASGHRAILVFEGVEVVGVLTMRNLIEAVLPDYLKHTQGTWPHGVQFSTLFWRGFFTARAQELEKRSVREIMNPKPPVVRHDASLMHTAHLLCEDNRRRVVVEKEGRVIGVVREQELFHEISRQILNHDQSM